MFWQIVCLLFQRQIKVRVRTDKWPIRPEPLIPISVAKWSGIFLFPTGGNASPLKSYPRVKFTGTHLYTWVVKGTVRPKCLAQGYNIMSPAMVQTQTAQSGNEHRNHEAKCPHNQPHYQWIFQGTKPALNKWKSYSTNLQSRFYICSRATLAKRDRQLCGWEFSCICA